MQKKWFIILNPTSGKFSAEYKIEQLKKLLVSNDISFELKVTQYKKHDFELTQNALKKGYRKFICIGGDGTLHYMVNAVMKQNHVSSKEVKIAVIPVGTGNDWVKTYDIPKNFKKAISIIRNGKTTLQDIGRIIINENNNVFYFNNIAGVGFDGLVVKNHHKFKKMGALSYLFSTLSSYKQYQNNKVNIQFEDKNLETDLFILAAGIGKFSGGGMQLTDHRDHVNGKFDISLIKKIGFKTIIKSIPKVFQGNISNIKEFNFYRTSNISVKYHTYQPLIQADGELLGAGNCSMEIIPEAIQFIVK
jgi:YegS/Rv2252/BmrU family lipid kinase